MALRSALVNVMAGASLKAARGLLRDFGEVEQLQASRKGPAGFVGAAARRAESTLLDELRRARPDYGALSAEGVDVAGRGSSRRWLVDPIGGATNYLHGVPHFCTAIALVEDGRCVAGTIYDPVRDEMFWAERGAGAYLNDRRLRVSARAALTDAVVATGLGRHGGEALGGVLERLESVAPKVAGVRRPGSAALDLAYVAAGRYEGCWQAGLEPWHQAAGIVLVREAGGYVSDLDGGERMLESGTVVAANDSLHRAIAGLVGAAAAPSR